MNKYLVTVACTAEIASVPAAPGSSLNFRVLYYEAESEDDVLAQVESREPVSYLNSEGEQVTWPMIAVMSIDEFDKLEPGEEVAGFIASLTELSELT